MDLLLHEVDLLESLLQPMVAAGHSLREEDEAEAKKGQSPEEVQNQDLERFLQQPDPGLVPDEAADSDEDHDSLWSSMAEGLPPETLSSEEFQSLVDGFRNTVQDTMESAGQEDPKLAEVMSQLPGILKKALESGEDTENLWYDIHRYFMLLQDTVEKERIRTLSALGYHTWMKSDPLCPCWKKCTTCRTIWMGWDPAWTCVTAGRTSLSAWRWSLSRSTE